MSIEREEADGGTTTGGGGGGEMMEFTMGSHDRNSQLKMQGMSWNSRETIASRPLIQVGLVRSLQYASL